MREHGIESRVGGRPCAVQCEDDRQEVEREEVWASQARGTAREKVPWWPAPGMTSSKATLWEGRRKVWEVRSGTRPGKASRLCQGVRGSDCILSALGPSL